MIDFLGVVGWGKVPCILCHRDVQLILSYIWARPAILKAGNGRGGCFYFFCFFTFIPVALPFASLSGGCQWCEGVVYLMSPVQLILAYSWARPAILVVGKGRGGMFLLLLFLYFHSCSSFFPVPLFHLFYYLFSPFLWEMAQNDPQELMCH